MSVVQLLKLRTTIIELCKNEQEPLAFVLVSNCINHKFEQVTCIALFDTKEQLEAYYNASLLSKPEVCLEGGYQMTRFFKQESLLRNFNLNAHVGFELTKTHCLAASPLWGIIDQLPVNPVIL